MLFSTMPTGSGRSKAWCAEQETPGLPGRPDSLHARHTKLLHRETRPGGVLEGDVHFGIAARRGRVSPRRRFCRDATAQPAIADYRVRPAQFSVLKGSAGIGYSCRCSEALRTRLPRPFESVPHFPSHASQSAEERSEEHTSEL